MKKFKKLSKSKIKKLNQSERNEYYKNAIEYYGNLPKQLKGYKVKGFFYPLIFLSMRIFPAKVIKLNEIKWPSDKKAVIFSANHSNSNDCPSLIQSIGKRFFALADFTMINDNVVNISNRINGCVYVDRKSKSSSDNAFNQCVDGVKRGYNMVVFPESTWNLTKSLPILPRYWGDVKIAKETGRPIIPVIMEYTGKVCLVKFGNCIYVSKDDSVADKDKEIYEAMVRLKNEIKDSVEYKKHYVPIEYKDWIEKSLKSYKYFDVLYEMSCIRKDDIIPQKEIDEIIKIGEKIRPMKTIKEELKYAKINYRYNDKQGD